MILANKRAYFLLLVAVSISLVLNEVNGAKYSKPRSSYSDKTVSKLLGDSYRKSGRYDGDSDERFEIESSRSISKVKDYVNDVVEDKLRGKFGKIGGIRDKFLDESDESNEYKDYAKKPKYRAPIYRDDKQFTVPLKSQKDNLRYYTTVYIGTPPQPFTVRLSSTVSFFWVPAAYNSINSKYYYDPKRSYTSKCKDYPWTLDGLVVPPNGADNTSGLVTCQDIVNIGGLTLHGQTFGLAKYIDDCLINRFKGVLGLGFQYGDIFYADTALTTIGKQNVVSNNIFSVWLNKNLKSRKDGEITFGGINSQLFYGPLTYISLNYPNKAWEIKVEKVAFGNAVLGEDVDLQIDMTEECMHIPEAALEAIFTATGFTLNPNSTGAENFFLPCNATSQLPALNLAINTWNYGLKTFSISPSVYLLPYPYQYDICFICFEIFPSDKWILGANFIRQYYTVFDADRKRIGIADSRAIY